MTTRPPVFRPKFVRSSADRKKDYDRWRGSAHSRGYDRKWAKARNTYLKEHPLCERCSSADRPVIASLVHHKIHTDEAPELILAVDNLMSLCNNCHGLIHADDHF